MNDDKFLKIIILIVVCSLSVICMGVVGILLEGLFNKDVDNDKIFEIIGPAFNTVIGAFVGLLGGLSINKSKCKE